MKLKLEGNGAFKNGDYVPSIKEYHEAYAAIHTVVEGRRYAILLDGYFASPPLTGKLAGQRRDLLRHQLGSQLNWKKMQAYLGLKDWQIDYFWGASAISDFEYAKVHQSILDGADNLITDVERAKAYFRMTIACHELGKYAEATNNFRNPTMYAPPDGAMGREIKKTRREIMQKNQAEKGKVGILAGGHEITFGADW